MSLLDFLHLHRSPDPHPVGDLIHWDSCLSVGNPMIDTEHKDILATMNRLYADWVSPAPHLDLGQELERIAGLVDAHFANEEEIMERRHCPALPGHRLAHRQLQAELRAIADAMPSLGHAKLEAHLLNFMRKLVMGHVLSWDMDAKDYLHT